MPHARKVRLVSAALAAAVVATLAPALTAPAVANAEDVPSFCPAGTVRAETFDGDDFDPGTARDMGTWTSDPEGSFAPVQDDSGDWLLRGGPAESKSQSSAHAGDEILIPQGGHVFLALDHEISGTDLRTVTWVELDGPQTHDFAPFNDATADRVFDGDYSRRTSYADLSEWRGQRVKLTATIQKGSGDYYTQWDIHDLSFVACYDDEASAPENVRGNPGLRNATVTWEPPVQHADRVSEYQVHLYNLADRSKDRSVTVGPDRRSHKFRRLIRGHTYQAAVAVGDRVSTDPRKLFRSKVTFRSKMRRVVGYSGSVPFKGYVYCPTGNDYTRVEVLLRKKKTTDSRWRTARKTESSPEANGPSRWYDYLRPARNMRVRAVYRGGAYKTWWQGEAVERCMGNRTNFEAVIRVRPWIKLLTEGSHSVQYAAYRGEPVHFSGKVRPYNAGRKVKLQRYEDGAWRVIKRKRLNKKSRFHFWVRHYSDGKYRYRVVTPKHERNAWGRSNVTRVVV